MDNNETKPSWREKLDGKQDGNGLPKLAEQFDDAPSSGNSAAGVFPPARPAYAAKAESSDGNAEKSLTGGKSEDDANKSQASGEHAAVTGANIQVDKTKFSSPAPLPPAASKPAGAAMLPPPPPPPAKSTGPARGMPLPPPPPAAAAPKNEPTEAPAIEPEQAQHEEKTDIAERDTEKTDDAQAVQATSEPTSGVEDSVSEEDSKVDEDAKPRALSPQTFAERLRARREEAEKAGQETPSDGTGRGLHLRPAEEPDVDAQEGESEPIANGSEQDSTLEIAAEPENGDVVADPPVFGKRAAIDDTSDLQQQAPPEAPTPAKPVIAARPNYDYSASAAKPVAPPPPPPAGLSAPGIAPPPGPASPYAQGASRGASVAPPAAAAAVSSAPAAPSPGYAPPPSQSGFAAPPASQPGPAVGEQPYQQYYGYADDRFEQAAPEGYRSAHARELDYADEGPYDGQYTDRRATAADYEYAYNEYDERYEEEPRSKLGPILLLCGLLLVGGIAAGLIWYFLQKDGNSVAGGGAPPVVSASPSDVKVTPPTSGQPQAPKQTKLFYDRIVGEQTVEGERLVPREEQPLDPAQNAQPSGSQAQPPAQLPEGELPVPQLPPPLPGNSSSVSPKGDATVQQASAQNGKSSRGDAVPLAASGKQSLGLSAPQTITDDTVTGSATQQVAGLSDPTTSVSSSASASPPPLPRTKPENLARAARAKAAAQAAARTASAPAQAAVSTANQGGPLDLSPTNLSTPAAPIPPPEPTQQVASLQQTPPPAPVQQVQQPQPAPAPTQQPVSDGAYIVQLAAYKDEGSARSGYSDLQGRHPSILGSYQPIISQTKVGSFGTFYRLQVGPISNSQSARQMCSTLLAAGEKDCTVKRR
ncbi:MAG: SPOR domain-containing protein [Hyphomicrobiales bacterium]